MKTSTILFKLRARVRKARDTIKHDDTKLTRGERVNIYRTGILHGRLIEAEGALRTTLRLLKS